MMRQQTLTAQSPRRLAKRGPLPADKISQSSPIIPCALVRRRLSESGALLLLGLFGAAGSNELPPRTSATELPARVAFIVYLQKPTACVWDGHVPAEFPPCLHHHPLCGQTGRRWAGKP